MDNLWIVMPVFNEEGALPAVMEEWLSVLHTLSGLRATAPGFTFCALNDGSKDRSGAILDDLAGNHPEVRVVHKPNTGHGQSCVTGYRLAVDQGADWILQIDSDGQCDPRFFPAFWQDRGSHPVQYGYRRTRDDGYRRFLISRIVSLVTWIATGVWVKDPNVPYRLMHRSTLEPILDSIPPDFHLANILVAVLQQKRSGIRWRTIHFRNRTAGTPSVKVYMFSRHGWKLFRQLRGSARS